MEIIWDGLEFRQVSNEEAARLVKEDKAEICEGQCVKYRHEFKGYLTREMRAEPVISREPVEIAEPDEADWKDYKDEAKEALGLKRISKAQVLEWMKDQGIS